MNGLNSFPSKIFKYRKCADKSIYATCNRRYKVRPREFLAPSLFRIWTSNLDPFRFILARFSTFKSISLDLKRNPEFTRGVSASGKRATLANFLFKYFSGAGSRGEIGARAHAGESKRAIQIRKKRRTWIKSRLLTCCCSWAVDFCWHHRLHSESCLAWLEPQCWNREY